ncbi:MAG: D-cysteine desulfhydrase [Betaproteobacteria bacterium]|nr:D-cysteine desulfhydrase [Betaproteobacteria bacterium]
MDLSRFARRRYSQGPTPIESMPRLSAALGGPQFWIKRDDMLGLAPGGNKTRKLEFLVADALAQSADCLIIKEGLECHVVIEERVPDSYHPQASGNHFLFRLLGMHSMTVVPAGTDMAAAMLSLADALQAKGKRPYIIPGGGSNALGGLGYVACAQEIQQQCFDEGLRFDHVVVGSGSSGTHGGLVAGFVGNHIDIPIIGIGVSREPEQQEPLVYKEACAVAALLGGFEIPRDRVKSIGGYWQPKYSVPNPMMIEAVRLMARSEAILLDPVYTGKVVAGMIGLTRARFFKPEDKVLLIHTGGASSLSAYEAVLLDA